MSSSLSIDRTSLSLDPLVFPSAGFELGEQFSPGGVTWARTFAASRFVDDETLTSARRTGTQLGGELRVVDADPAALQALEAELVAALSQFTYSVTWSEVGTTTATYTWTCWPADLAPTGDQFFDYLRAIWVQGFTVAIPRRSVPIAGSF